LACQQLSQGSGSLPEFGGKPQLGVNGTVNELMLAAGGWGGTWLGGACAHGALRGTWALAPGAATESPSSGSHALGEV